MCAAAVSDEVSVCTGVGVDAIDTAELGDVAGTADDERAAAPTAAREHLLEVRASLRVDALPGLHPCGDVGIELVGRPGGNGSGAPAAVQAARCGI